MSLNQYLLAAGSPPATKGGILEEWILIYNNSAVAIANGAIKVVGYFVETTPSVFASSSVTTPGLVAVPLAPTTQDLVNKVGVVDNDTQILAGLPPTTYDGILAYGTGWLKLKGIVKALVDGTTDVALGDTLKVINAGTAFIQDVASAGSGATGVIGVNSVAISLATYTTNSAALEWVYLIGKERTVPAA